MQLTTETNHVVCGSNDIANVTVRMIGRHDSIGVLCEATTYRMHDRENFVQLRQHRSDPVVALFAFARPIGDVMMPGYWEGSTVIWDSRDGGVVHANS
jgi:hypothetical protein